MIVMYSTNCPKCKILEKKLNEKQIEYNLVTDVDEMIKLGIDTAPMLSKDDKLLGFREAIEWVNKQ